MKTVGVAAVTSCVAGLSTWIFSLFGTVTSSYEFIAGGVSAIVTVLALLIASIVAEEIG